MSNGLQTNNSIRELECPRVKTQTDGVDKNSTIHSIHECSTPFTICRRYWSSKSAAP